ncbi:hypothetical protein KIH27_06810 [Mycobacterium sp. M1]|uniref:Transmembrane protein n=1 Tax=Mycolicibacter acidiphilus TaxID=2835306 RepID=A0ABS5RK35_9MYCO|nr:hypothetical protein [Mycolicibacter acidiphilus]
MAPAYALGLTALLLAPLLRPGYLLLRDAVSTPRSYLTDAALGVGEGAPRAVPQDFAVALGSHLVDGGVLVKAVLFAGVWLAGWGAARLVVVVLPTAGVGGQLAAATLAVWNPYVAERLLQGHWSLLVGYGCLPWVAAAVLRMRTGEPSLFALVFFVAVAGLTPTGLILAAVTALACAGLRRLGVVLAIAVAAALPWAVAYALHPVTAPADPTGVPAFAARAEPGLGTLGSVAGLGGIWNADAVPGSRTTLFAVVATLVLLGVVAVGLPTVWRRRAARPLLVLAAVAVLLIAVSATGPGLVVLQRLIEAVPGMGVLRDGQKWVALAMPGYALAAAGATMVFRRLTVPITVGICTALIAVLPDLAWGVWGRVEPVRYPAAWPAVAATINADPHPVAVLPAGVMRRFPWAGPTPVLDPLPRWVRAEVLSTGDLDVGGATVLGEGARARTVQDLLLAPGFDPADPAALRDAGVGWLVVEGPADLTLSRIGGDTPGAPADRRRAALAAHLVWLGLLVAGVTGMVLQSLQRARRR